MAGGKGGRPSKLTKQLCERICGIIAAGNYRETAVKVAGVSLRTLYYWVSRGKTEPHSKYRRFLQAVIKAEAKAETVILERLLKQGEVDPKCNMWYLERKFPQRWSRDREAIREIKKRLDELDREHRKKTPPSA